MQFFKTSAFAIVKIQGLKITGSVLWEEANKQYSGVGLGQG
jgi:hypothetical protein